MLNRGRVLVHSHNEQTMARFLPSRYKVLWALRVSRYKADRMQVSYHRIVILLTALAQYRGTSLQRSRY